MLLRKKMWTYSEKIGSIAQTLFQKCTKKLNCWQQEIAISQIAIENIRQAKLRELLERRRADLDALDRRQTLVPELELVGVAVVKIV